jgi:ATP-binding protein involved in chromosome partitioning
LDQEFLVKHAALLRRIEALPLASALGVAAAVDVMPNQALPATLGTLGVVIEPQAVANGEAGATDVAVDEPGISITLPVPLLRQVPYWRSVLTETGAAAVPPFTLPPLTWQVDVAAAQPRPNVAPLPGVRNLIVVASGKGGVGKSTTAVNLALALEREGARVGMLDADIYGPSLPTMLGIPQAGQPAMTEDKRLQPHRVQGIAVMSMGFLVTEKTPMVWRGPMVSGALMQLLHQTAWPELDYLIIDMPPGTGDIQLTLSQQVPVDGAVIVTTPQDVACLDARKGIEMFRKVNVPVLGLIENMSVYHCPQCGHAASIFGAAGGQALAAEYSVPLLGQLPLALDIRAQTDAGQPPVGSEPDSASSQAYFEAARAMAVVLHLQAQSRQQAPRIVIRDD